MSQSFIYVIQARNGAIKIGHSVTPDQRLATVRTHSPLPVRMIAILGPGGSKQERALHERFDHCRSHSEWFYGADIDAFSLEVMGRGLSVIENWCDLEFLGTHGRKERRRRIFRAIWENPERRLSASRGQVEWRVWRQFHPLLSTHDYRTVKAMAAAECARRRPDLFPTPAPQEAA